jgi:hypothetical protein
MSDIPEVKLSPIQMPRSSYTYKGKVQEGISRQAYAVYSHIYGDSQSFERLNERGGFGIGELVAYLYAHSYPKVEWRKRADAAFYMMALENKGKS